MIHLIRVTAQHLQVGDEIHVYDSLNTLHVHDVRRSPEPVDGFNRYLVEAEVRRGGQLGSGDTITLDFRGDQVITLNRDQPED
jgi:hypothetical protein